LKFHFPAHVRYLLQYFSFPLLLVNIARRANENVQKDVIVLLDLTKKWNRFELKILFVLEYNLFGLFVNIQHKDLFK